MTKKYLSNIFKTHQKGDAREESYYKHLADFFIEFSESKRNLPAGKAGGREKVIDFA